MSLHVTRLKMTALNVKPERMLEGLVKNCSSTRLIRSQIVVYFYSFRVYRAMKQTYERNHPQNAPSKPSKSEAPKILRAAPFPRLWPPLAWFEYVSTAWMYYALVKYLLPNFLDDERADVLARVSQQVEPDTLSPWSYFTDHRHCLVLGRFLMPKSTRNVSGALLAFIAIFRRLIFNDLNPSYTLGFFDFILQDEEAICQYLSEHRTRQFLAEADPQHQNSASTRELDKHNNGQANAKADLLVPLERGKESGPKQSSFDQFMCYPVRVGDKFDMRLRSNRTIEAHRLYRRQVARVTLIISSVVGLVYLVLGGPIVVLTLLDSRYLSNYPDCDSHMERLLASAQLHKWSMTLTWGHRSLALVADLAENVFFWLDSTLSITFVLGVPYLLTYDLRLCSRDLHKRIFANLRYPREDVTVLSVQNPTGCSSRYGQLWERREDDREKRSVESFSDESSERERSNLHQENEHSMSWCLRRPQTKGRTHQCLKQHQRQPSKWRHQRDKSMLQLQWELKDFFNQIRQADQLVSDFLTAGSLLWLGGVITFGFQLVKLVALQDTHDKAFVRYLSSCVNFAGLFAISSVSLGLFALYRNCQRLYVRLNTLMAYDSLGATQSNLMKILDLFSDRQGYAFTLFRQYPFTQMRFLSLCSWTISGLAILLSWY